MDTNQNVANNYQINTFTKGMNSDTSYDMIGADQYLFGQNIRITNNTLLLGDLDANNTEMVVAPVHQGYKVWVSGDAISHVDKILAVDSIGNIGVLIIKLDNGQGSPAPNHWRVYKVEKIGDTKINSTLIYTSSETTTKDRFSITMIQETKDVLKVYIADGKNPVMMVFLDNSEIGSVSDIKTFYSNITDDRYLCSDQYFPIDKPILSKISGNLKTQQVQYTYRFYRRYGTFSKMSPLTNKIQIIGTNRSVEAGNAEDTLTDIGMHLKISTSSEVRNLFDYVQIFRISFIKPQQVPQIDLIYDKKIPSADYFEIDDSGVQSITQYSLDEFSALQGQTLIPKILEQNQNYMFIANTKDETIIDDSALSGYSAALSFVTCNIQLDNSSNTYDQIPVTQPSDTPIYLLNEYEANVCSITQYFTNQGVVNSDNDLSYNNMFVSSLLRSLRYGGENYQYGIVYYDKYGNRSNVQPLPLITTPTTSPFATNEGNTVAKSLGLKVVVTKGTNTDIVGFQIVRCERSFDYVKNVLQVALSRPMRQGRFGQETYRTPYYPNVYLSSQFFYTYYGSLQTYNTQHATWPLQNYNSDVNILGPYLWKKETTPSDQHDTLQYGDNSGTNVENHSLYQIFSPEINIERNSTLARLSGTSCKLSSISYLYEDRTLWQSIASLSESSTQQTFDYLQYYVHAVSFDSHSTYFNGVNQSSLNSTTKTDVLLFGIDTGIKAYQFDVTSTGNDDGDVLGIVYIPAGVEARYIAMVLDGNNDYVPIEQQSAWHTFQDSVGGGDSTIKIVYANSCNSIEYDTGISYGQSTLKIELIPYIIRDYTNNPPQTIRLAIDINNTVSNIGRCLYSIKNDTLFPPGISSNQILVSELQEGTPIDNVTDGAVHPLSDYVYLSVKENQVSSRSQKISQNSIFKLNKSYTPEITHENLSILHAADVKNPSWENGFSDIQIGSWNSKSVVQGAIKQYKSYTTSIGGKNYNNWVSNGMYDLATCNVDAASQAGNAEDGIYRWVFGYGTDNPENRRKDCLGFIGPGPVCLLINTEKPAATGSIYRTQIRPNGYERLGTIVANIWHNPMQYNSQLQPYYGFGNFFKIDGSTTTKYVFDGEIYPMFAEFVNMFKTYDFNDKYATIPSGQIVYYIPLESRINTNFDYGCNYRNTQSANLMLEPGQITGVATQSRPLHQYNMVYSDNDYSIDTFFAPSEKEPIKEIAQRICYSQLKTSGENIDNFQLFKPADYIDADSRYGEITNLLASDNNIYFWQTNAFGKLSVNERSLVTDDNGETIQLGQGGVLQRVDYISTKYGMREQDFCAIDTEDAIYWIDILNKAVLMCKQNQVVNYGEALNVQNYINSAIIEDNRPTIDYDLQTNELLCGAFKSDDEYVQLIFNTKLGIAQSVYNRKYRNILYFNNLIYAIDTLYSYPEFKLINYLQWPKTTPHTFDHYIPYGGSGYHYKSGTSEGSPIDIGWEEEDGVFVIVTPSSTEGEWDVYPSTAHPYLASVLTELNTLVANHDPFFIYLEERYSDQKTLYYFNGYSLTTPDYLYPTIIEFAINSSASQTKVFDNQKVVALKVDRSGQATENLMPSYLTPEHSAFMDQYFTGKTYQFETDITSTTNNPITLTDREGNICYAFPRTTSMNTDTTFDNQTSYGGRMRGKWLRERITDNSPKADYCISHIITKFRQSYS